MKLDSEYDKQLMQLVSLAMRQPAEERELYLSRICRDPDLRREAWMMVRTEEQMGNFLLRPVSTLQEAAPPFEPGQMIEDRFQIIREIGEGGMGVVYEALDHRRKIHIAIKVAKPGFQRLLSPELEGAIKVSHPNVCRVHEIHTAKTEHGEIDFLTMELLVGETLAAYLDAHGKVDDDEALEITRQLCAGLEAAHGSNIVHRDLKSANVILCKDEDDRLRVVITDFGLAADNATSDEWGGTPRYIAPELWKGEKASRASDIYALGVILVDLIGGPIEDDPAFASDSELPGYSAIRIPDGLPKRWRRIISRCLAPIPADRPASAILVLEGLERRSAWKKRLVGLSLVLSLTLLVPRVQRWLHDAVWPPTPNIRLAILTADDPGTAEATPGVLQDAVDRISHLKSEPQTLAVFPPAKVADMRVHDPEDARRVLQATHALQIKMQREGEDLIVSGSVIDLETQTRVKDLFHRYTPATVGAVPDALASEISVGLGLPGGRASEMLSPGATKPYDEGLSLLLNGRSVDEAMGFFSKASHLDPRSPVPLAALVEAAIKKFESSKDPADLNRARQYLQMAESLNPDSVKVHLAAGQLAEATGQLEKALRDYLRVKELEPHNIDAFVRVAGVYDKLDMPDLAIQEYRKAIQLDPQFYEPYQYFGVFYYFRGRYSDSAEQFRKVIERAPRLYRAYMNLDAALEALGRYAEAEQVLHKALDLGPTPGALNNMGALLAAENRDREAIIYSRQAVELSPNDYVYRLNLGDSYRRLGRLAESRVEYRKALESARSELKQNPKSGYVRAFVGYFSARLGDRKRAEDEIAQALQSAPGNARVMLRAVLTYDALGMRQHAMAVLAPAPADLLREVARDPDLADFTQNLRFKKLVAGIPHGGS